LCDGLVENFWGGFQFEAFEFDHPPHSGDASVAHQAGFG
jgi:hypothetical protein